MELIDHSRGLICINGEDAASFLQGIITQDIKTADEKPVFSAMLSPQGKWNEDFFIIKQDANYLLDCNRLTRDALIKKLSLYKLKAKVTIQPVEGWSMAYVESPIGTSFADPRHAKLPARYWCEANSKLPDNVMSVEQTLITRLNLGIPEGGIDATQNETLLDLGYDLLNAVSFTKGCYVGQEVTARMHYKSISRKGFYHVEAASELPKDAKEIMIGDKVVGELRSRHEKQGLMFARFDEIGDSKEAKIGGISVTLTIPDWLKPRYELFLKNQET